MTKLVIEWFEGYFSIEISIVKLLRGCLGLVEKIKYVYLGCLGGKLCETKNFKLFI